MQLNQETEVNKYSTQINDKQKESFVLKVIQGFYKMHHYFYQKELYFRFDVQSYFVLNNYYDELTQKIDNIDCVS